MMNDPNIDHERMKQWKANVLPVPSAELLKGKGSSPSPSSGGLTNEAFIKMFQYVKDPRNGWVYLGSSHNQSDDGA